ncbi:MAG: dockerin type I repeat-containing protein [Patescibacteria group bacterium]|nr:dockerin type I repeat-containing protein [Patescibacteria group bacterium]
MILKRFLIFIFIFFSLLTLVKILKSSSINVTAIVPGICGNNLKEIREECDGIDLGGQNCVSLGYSGGALSCNSNCTFNTSQCITGGGSSGGGGGTTSNIPQFQYGLLIISGRAYPNSEVTLLSDGEIKIISRAGSRGDFEITLSNLSPGFYIFTLYSEDARGRKSSLLNFQVNIIAGQTIRSSNIFLSPTIDIDKKSVRRGDILQIFGQATPESDVIISVSSEEERFFKVTTERDGSYLHVLDTSILELGEHYTKSRQVYQNRMVSPYSPTINFLVSTKTVEKKIEEKKRCPQKGDLNGDCRVNLVDFSIAAFWYKKKKLSENFKRVEKEKLNGDGKINLVDFSIMAYYWTG